MITLKTLSSNPGSRKRSRKIGRWNGSGRGTFCGRGMNGQNCRSGGWVPDWFEWGQTPLFRRMPKLKGFSNAKFMTKFNVINLADISKLADKWITEITKEVLLENNIIRKKFFFHHFDNNVSTTFKRVYAFAHKIWKYNSIWNSRII